ncbi:hypothetical protein [Paracoccus aestuariivivens]|uniref:Uncharacterized protein n=1 Tax=Paracoccus aestuariivivens TaxID=1820333 RepID=A0A6L6JFH6_9RHOB|nr:hypothetical protein [Paracoccus aestuariivivens]MTH79918.1 hypothetical protein [Paracoccus aestuariivivens]
MPQPATLFLSNIEPVLGSVEPTPTGYTFALERMILPEGEMPRDNVASLVVEGSPEQRVHLENVNVARVEEQSNMDLFRGRIILRSENAPQP